MSEVNILKIEKKFLVLEFLHSTVTPRAVSFLTAEGDVYCSPFEEEKVLLLWGLGFVLMFFWIFFKFTILL